MIAYHWSPSERRAGILRRGLVVGAKPTVNVDHKNTHISLARYPSSGWALSADHMRRCGRLPDFDFMSWDLWEVNLRGLKYKPLHKGSNELVVKHDIPASCLTRVGILAINKNGVI